MLRTFQDLYTEVETLTYSTTSNQTTRAKQWVNQAYNRVVYDVQYPFLRRQDTFSTVIGQRLYVPAANAMEILNMRIPSENRYLVKANINQIDKYRPQYITDTNNGIPYSWYNEDWVGTSTAIATTGAVVYAASDATETATTAITVEGISNGEVQRETLSLSASATPSATGTKTFTQILSISKNSVTVGTITFRQTNSSGTILGALGPYRRSNRYIRIGLEYIPQAVYTVYFKYTPWMAEMVNDSDVPLIPERDTMAILNGAMLFAAENNGDMDTLASREKKYNETIARIRERVTEDAETTLRFGFDDGRNGPYPQVANYNSYLAWAYWN